MSLLHGVADASEMGASRLAVGATVSFSASRLKLKVECDVMLQVTKAQTARPAT
jgi:hypothetical protein